MGQSTVSHPLDYAKARFNAKLIIEPRSEWCPKQTCYHITKPRRIGSRPSSLALSDGERYQSRRAVQTKIPRAFDKESSWRGAIGSGAAEVGLMSRRRQARRGYFRRSSRPQCDNKFARERAYRTTTLTRPPLPDFPAAQQTCGSPSH